MKRIKAAALLGMCMAVFTACRGKADVNSVSELEQGIQAVEEAVNAERSEISVQDIKSSREVREGTSADTVATPEDFPMEYDYGSGRISDWSREDMLKKTPKPKGNETVLNTVPNPAKIQALYLWEEGNVPAVTRFTEDMDGYFDEWDFRPYVTAIPVRDGVKPKGAVVLMAGGAYQFRGNYTDSLPTAAALREYGFQTFLVDYRLRPYTQEEGALDVARAVRFIRKYADMYGIAPDNIAVMGFSAGGIQAGEFLMHYDEMVDGTKLDADYIPDELDDIPAHTSAAGMIYSFYGRLSVGNMDPDWLSKGELPPTFYVYGTEDPFYTQFEEQYEVIKTMGIDTGRIVLNNWPHGFGSDGGWVEDYAQWLEGIFPSGGALETAGEEGMELFTPETRIQDVIGDPAFEGFGRLVFPVDLGLEGTLTLKEAGNRLVWYSHVNPERTVSIVNEMKARVQRGEKIFYDIYTDEEKKKDPSKEDTGLFYFRGDPGEKFAVVNAGGGFMYVAAMHDSFPHMQELAKQGYHAFALIYRPGAQTACEDLARAVAFIQEHAEEFQVHREGYSLWGGSAGARMAAWLGSYGTAAFGEKEYPAPGAVIMQYTGLSEVYGNEPPTYACVGVNDGIASYRTMERRIRGIRANGTAGEIEVFDGLSHGFGLGEGTVAEGWINRAVAFWEENTDQ